MQTWEDMYPSLYPIENKIKLLLVMKGYDRNKICFRGSKKDRELRYAYFEYIHKNDILYIENTEKCVKFNPLFTEDDDCGNLSTYPFKILGE